MLKTVVAVIGSTGVGKSKLAIDLAKALHGEVVNADAMQMYRGFDIITNKVTPDECDGVPHHLLDHLAVDQEYTVADFERDALAKIAEIHARDRLPILVGGTHYYLQAVLWRQSLVSGRPEPVAASSPPPRSTFPDLHAMDNTNLHALLQELDPVVARRWHPNDRRKVVRSLEVLRDTGRPHSDWMQETQAASGQAQRLRFNTCIFWIHAAKDALDPRLDARVDEMIQRGLYNELRSLRRLRSTAAGTDSPRDYTHGILQAIGLKEFEPMLQAAEDLPTEDLADDRLSTVGAACLETMKLRTRQYARRQTAWIRNKLLPAYHATLATGGVAPRSAFYVLDATDLERWSERVGTPGLATATDFIRDAPLRSPTEIHAKAAVLLAQPAKSEAVDEWRKYTCPECTAAARGQVVELNGTAEWKAHRGSRRHRRALKWQTLQAQRRTHLATVGTVDDDGMSSDGGSTA